jgi:hypothetical protein
MVTRRNARRGISREPKHFPKHFQGDVSRDGRGARLVEALKTVRLVKTAMRVDV